MTFNNKSSNSATGDSPLAVFSLISPTDCLLINNPNKTNYK